MEAHRREPEPGTRTEPARTSDLRPRRAPVPMSELLESCAAADAVSTPPSFDHDPREGEEAEAA